MDAQGRVDGYRFLPPALRALFSREIPEAGFVGEIPWAPLKKPAKRTVFSLMTSSGISLRTDKPFDMEREKREPFWGDPSYRAIPRDTPQDMIDAHHLHVDTGFIRQDVNVALPLARFAEFEQEGVIGSLAPTCYSFYGYQHDFTSLMQDTLPEVASRMLSEGVEAVLITPGCPLCCRTIGLVARFLEARGISSVCLTMIPEFTRLIGIPRVAAVEHPFGRPVGQVHDAHGQRKVLIGAISFLEEARVPGEVRHLPFTWPEEPKETKWHPSEMSPILRLFRDELAKVREQEKKRTRD